MHCPTIYIANARASLMKPWTNRSRRLSDKKRFPFRRIFQST